MKKVRLGIIGIGNMGSGHANNILKGLCPEIQLCAVADINPDRIRWAEENLPADVAKFDTAEKLMDIGLVDAILVELFLKGLVCLVVPNAINVLIFSKTEEMRSTYKMIRNILKKSS